MPAVHIVDELRAALHDPAALGSERVITAPETCRAFECDGLSSHRLTPEIVVLPSSLEEIRAVLEVCRRHRLAVVTRGAGTGLSGGAMPVAGAVLLVLTRMNRLLEVDCDRRIARVQPGVTNLSISHAVRRHGLFYAPDPSSQIACTIGGNVAENSGGVHCLKYGLTYHNVLEVKFLTMAGDLLTLGNEMQETQGLELLALVTGSEGMLGVVVEVMVKLLPLPKHTELILAAFDDIESCADAVAHIIAAGIVPAGLEMMDAVTSNAVEDFVHCGYPANAAALLLCEVDGIEADVAWQKARVVEVLEADGATQIRVAASVRERDKLWSGRKSAFPAVAKLAPDYYCMDGTIPRAKLASTLHSISEISKRYGLQVANVFHAGDGNLHPLILFDAARAGELERAEELGAHIAELSVSAGGTVTGEHGVGVEKLGPMCVQFNRDELELFHALKAAFDPLQLLNPGKAIPTLARCADYRAMHVHAGELAHADLPRF